MAPAILVRLLNLTLALAVACVTSTARASANVDAASALMVLPVVAQTSSFASEVTVFNPQEVGITLSVAYVGGNGTSAVGLRSCTGLTVAARQSVQFNVAAQCSLPPGSQFGMLRLAEISLPLPAPFHANSRVANPAGIGFSIPAYPMAAFDTGLSEVIGLKRQAASPTYQTNCFLGSNGESTPFQLKLFSASNVQIGTTLSDTLGANELRRYLDVFSAVGAPPGNYINVRAELTTIGGNGASLVAFCTVQDNTSFGADFRIAGETDPADTSRTGLTAFPGTTFTFASYGLKSEFFFGFRAPDSIRCMINGSQANALELRVKDPYGNVVAGGNNVSDTGRFFIGPHSFYPYSTFWTVEISVSESATPTYPIQYGFLCASGNGHDQLGVATDLDDF